MVNEITITYEGKDPLKFPKGTSLYEVSKSYQKYFNYTILAAKVDNDVIGLNETLTKSADVHFYDRSTYHGNSTYGRTLQFIMIVAVAELFKGQAEVVIEHSIDKGFYSEIYGINIDRPQIQALEDYMHKLVSQDIVIPKLSVSRL